LKFNMNQKNMRCALKVSNRFSCFLEQHIFIDHLLTNIDYIEQASMN